MPPRKRKPAGPAATARPAGGDAATVEPSPPVEPVRKVRIRPDGEGLVRAGGHVLTERGWVPARTDEEE